MPLLLIIILYFAAISLLPRYFAAAAAATLFFFFFAASPPRHDDGDYAAADFHYAFQFSLRFTLLIAISMMLLPISRCHFRCYLAPAAIAIIIDTLPYAAIIAFIAS